jgi:predicted transport protein
MKSAIYIDGNRFIEIDFKVESDLEKIIKDNSKILFGSNTVYFDLKNKIDTRSLGTSIPDGFLFDFKDKDNPEFYLIEAELAKHDFYEHIFPQITKFFAFFKNPQSRNNLTEKLFSFVKSNEDIESEFQKYLGKKEIYKALKDVIENSQNILLIIDEMKPELQEVFETYTDTWDKMVKFEILKRYTANNKMIFMLNPDFQNIGFVESPTQKESGKIYTEYFHTEDVEKNIVAIYEKIKDAILALDPNIKVNPQRYYISLRDKRNFTFFDIKRKKIHIVIMLRYEKGEQLIKKQNLIQLTQSVQDFYNGSCFQVTLENETNLDEVIKAIEAAYKQQNKK